MAYFCRGGLFVPTNHPDKFKKRYTFSRQEGFGAHIKTVYYPYYLESENGILIPRLGAPNTITNKVYSEGLKFNLIDTVFTANQILVCDFIINRFKTLLKEDKGKPIRTGLNILAGTGIGKSYMGLYLIHRLKKKALYIVYDKKSLNAIYDLFVAKTDAKVGRYYGDKKEDGDIIIMIVNTALNTPPEYFYKFGTIIYDEITEYASRTRINLFFLTLGVYNIGMTATREKKGLEIIYEEIVGPFLDIEQVPGYNLEEITFTGVVLKVRHKIAKERIVKTEDGRYISFMSTIKRFHEDEVLTRIVLDKIGFLMSLDKRVIIFSDIKSYLYHFFYKVKEKSKLILVGGACQEDYEEAKTAKLIFSTYKFAEKALSLKDTDAVFYLTPHKDANQSSGRAFRRDGNPFLTRYIVDIIHSCFAGQERFRDVCYEERGLEIREDDMATFGFSR